MRLALTATAPSLLDIASQVAALQAAGCGNIFKEKASGAKTDRPELAKAIRRLEAGDVLVVTRLDRLARSTRDLLNVLDQIGNRYEPPMHLVLGLRKIAGNDSKMLISAEEA